jgi:hypothetical protein
MSSLDWLVQNSTEEYLWRVALMEENAAAMSASLNASETAFDYNPPDVGNYLRFFEAE